MRSIDLFWRDYTRTGRCGSARRGDLLVNRKARSSRQQRFDGIGEVLIRDVVVAALNPKHVSLHQHIGRAEVLGSFERVARGFDLRRNDQVLDLGETETA
jgi:hypothetical protein